ncbi:MAG: conserved membrane protein of unknown function [Promethearchaeota archaeon]|nr:MAG: conserved membrane protein of unknown function [Candidatus Lokiarchaeota archaeon]
MGKRKAVDIRKKRKKLIKLREEKLEEAKSKEGKGKKKEIDVRLEKETKLYWARATVGFASAFIGRLMGFVGWLLLIWMLLFMLLFPFLASFIIFRFEYEKEEWNWKKILSPGLGIFFFLFMITSTIIHTLCLYYGYPITISISGVT